MKKRNLKFLKMNVNSINDQVNETGILDRLNMAEKALEKTINSLLWRLNDEITYRNLQKTEGGYFQKFDWIAGKTDEQLEEIQSKFIECRKMINEIN